MRTIVSALRGALFASLMGLAAVFLPAGRAEAQNAIDLHNLVEFNANVQPTFSSLRFNTRTGATTIKVTLTNLSAVAVPAPIYLAIMNISALSARVENATGIDVNGTPFFVVGQTLQPGQAVSFDVLFGNTGRNRFTFTPRAFGVVADLFVTIDDPVNLALTNQSQVDVSGRTTMGASVTVNGIAGVVMGDTYTVADVPLSHEGSNALSATAQDAMGHVANVASTVIRDTTPPTVVIGFPHEGAVVFNDTISVQAAVNDPIAGLMMAAPPTATVNGVPAAFENGSLVAPSVQLTPGSNTITVDVTDPAGNASQAVVHVTYDDTAVAKIRVFSGNDQSAPISQLLPQPLVAQLLDQAGAPVANAMVRFRVVMSNGVFTDATRLTSATTDVNGLASVQFIGGSRTGQGCNAIEATATGFEGAAQFISTSTGGTPAKISASQGEMQRAAVSSQAPMALVAFVTDVGNNPLPGIKVIFNVVAGGGHFAENDGTALGVTTDMMGRVSAILVTGPLQGVENNLVEAKIEQAPQFTPVRFAVTSLTPGDPAQTTFSGLVLDHTDTPLPNVHIHMSPGNLTTFTDAAGQFTLTNVQVGPVHLTADATTTTTPGTWGTLSFERVTIPGTDNSLGMPIHMLPMYLNNPIAGGPQDVTLLLPELPRFHLKIFANSCTFPNGDRTGLVSVTAVRTDKIPMPPADGMSPNFIITVQPPDVLFSPPAEFAVPNVEGLVPGEMTNMFSFDHDLGRFVSIGPGTCSEDGTVIVSQPGFGIVKAGWHCAGPGQAQGDAVPVDCVIADASKNQVTCVDKNVVLSAAGTPLPGTMSWSGGETPPTKIGNAFTTKFSVPMIYNVTATYTCAETGESDSDMTSVTVVDVKFVEEAPCKGFDGSVDPPWLVVPKGGTAKAKAVISPVAGANKVTFTSAAMGTATVAPATASTSPETLTVTGVTKAETDVIAKAGTTECKKLRVSVKEKKTIKVSFHFISDSSGTATTRVVGIEDGIIARMNEIWTPQANVVFEKKSVDSPIVAKDMGAVVRFSSHLAGVPAAEHDWDDVIAKGDAGADLNVFFVWEYEQDDTPAVDGADAAELTGNMLFEDNAGADIGETFAHEGGHFLGLVGGLGDYVDRVDELMHAFTDVRGCIIRKAQADVSNP